MTMLPRISTLAIALAGAALVGCSGAAQQPETTFTSSAKADEAEMEATTKATAYSLATPGSDIETGGAIILVKAPMDRVLEEVQRFDNYKNILPRLKDARVVERREDGTDVYMRAPVMDGSVAIWAVSRFSKPKPFGKGGKQITSRYIKGNLESFRGVWKLEPISETETKLRVELFVVPKLPVPDSWVTPELMWASRKAATAVRDTVEKGESSVKDD